MLTPKSLLEPSRARINPNNAGVISPHRSKEQYGTVMPTIPSSQGQAQA